MPFDLSSPSYRRAINSLRHEQMGQRGVAGEAEEEARGARERAAGKGAGVGGETARAEQTLHYPQLDTSSNIYDMCEVNLLPDYGIISHVVISCNSST